MPTEIVREVIWSAAGTNAVLVGGQALGVWVDLLLDPDLIDDLGGPVTSKDVDFFGNVEVANELAKRLDGRVVIPGPDHVNTPEAAIVLYERHGISYQIDILGRLAGLTEREINDGWVEIPHGEGEDEIVVRVLAPIEIMRSRIANIVILRRDDPGAVRQLRISPHIVEAYIRQQLDALIDPEIGGDKDRLKGLQNSTQDMIREVIRIGRNPEMDRLFIDHGLDLLACALKLAGHPAWHPTFNERQIVNAATEGIERRAIRIAERERKSPGFAASRTG